MHFCYESEKTVSGPICSRIVALYHQNSHNAGQKSVNWQFKTADARTKLKHLYPILNF